MGSTQVRLLAMLPSMILSSVLVFTCAIGSDAAANEPGHMADSVPNSSSVPGWNFILSGPNAPGKLAEAVVNVLESLRANVMRGSLDDVEARIPAYDRREDFGGWIVADSSVSCLDTRGTVLVNSADPSTKITYRDSSKCSVTKGLWHDPYSGDDFKLATTMQIDHVVPLKHAYLTGAHKWSPQRRCYYANFLNNSFHLLAVNGHENMSKGDNAPNEYLPPDESYQCQYVANWMKVKAIWKLASTADEISAVEDVIREHHCADSKFQMTDSQITRERKAITDTVPARCRDFGSEDFVGSSLQL